MQIGGVSFLPLKLFCPHSHIYFKSTQHIMEIISKEGCAMDLQRAKEISQSPDMKSVTYNGRQVYIQHVDENSQIARVYHLDDTEREFEVDISTLQENEYN